MGGPADRLPELAVQPILWFNYVETPKVRSNARLLRAAAQERPASPRVRPPQKRTPLGCPPPLLLHGTNAWAPPRSAWEGALTTCI
jgi:hypothetical protein